MGFDGQFVPDYRIVQNVFVDTLLLKCAVQAEIFFQKHIFENLNIHGGLSIHLLQTAIFFLQFLESS